MTPGRLAGWSFLALTLLSGQAQAAISVVDSLSSAATGTSTSIGAPVTVSPSANVLVVLLATKNTTGAYSDPSSLMWNGQSLNQVASGISPVSTYRRASVYCLYDPTTDGVAHEVTGTGATGTSFWELKYFTLSGVDTAVSPLAGAAGAGSGTTSLSFAVADCPDNAWAAVCANWSSTNAQTVTFSGTGGTAATVSDYLNSGSTGCAVGMGHLSDLTPAGTDTFTATVINGNKCAFAAAVFTPAVDFTPPFTNSPPVITKLLVAETALELSGTNGMPNAFFEVLASTNLDASGSSWAALATNTFDAGGNFDSPLALSAEPVQFYQLRVPGGGAPPFITGSPQNRTIVAGQNTTFTVGARGAAPLGYQWFFGGDPLPVGGTLATLALTNVQSDDEGVYSVTVSNSFGLATSPGALLTVIAPPVITSPPQDQTLSVGQDATFVVVASGSPVLCYQWYFNTNTLLANATNDSLFLTNLQTTDAGQYSVVVTNTGGRVTNHASLAVNPLPTPPAIVTSPRDQTVTSGQTATFTVGVSGSTPLRYQWYFNTNTILVNATNSSLAITNAQTNNAGWYSVTVTNSLGTTNASARLTVLTNSSNQGLIGWATVADRGLTNTTGGAGGTTVTVSNITDLNTYALKAAPYIIQVSGTLSGKFSISSNKTIIGLPGATISPCNVDMTRGPNIILRNLRLVGYNCSDDPTCNGAGKDSITMEGTNVHHVWLDHLDISDGSDGNLDMTHSVDYVTVSWCKFWYSTPGRGHRLSNLISGADTSTFDRGHLKITYDHCWWSTNVNSRMPRGRFGQVHMINCYWNAPGNSSCVSSGVEMQVRVENGYFQSVNNPLYISATNGAIASVGNIFVNCSGTIDTGGTVFTPPYPYTLDPAVNVPAIVQAGAGPK